MCFFFSKVLFLRDLLLRKRLHFGMWLHPMTKTRISHRNFGAFFCPFKTKQGQIPINASPNSTNRSITMTSPDDPFISGDVPDPVTPANDTSHSILEPGSPSSGASPSSSSHAPLVEIGGLRWPRFCSDAEWPGRLAAIADFHPRPDDVFVVSFPKCGHHWSHEFLSMILSGQAELAQGSSLFLIMRMGLCRLTVN